MWTTLFLLTASLSQVVIGIAPTSVFTEVERPVAFQLGLVNFVGATIVLLGLHMKDEEVGLSLEFAGAFSLAATLGWYCVTVLTHQPLAGTTLGFSMPEAFLFATFHRGIQIFVLKASRWLNKPRLEDHMLSRLNPLSAPAKVESDGTPPRHEAKG
jgi:hypothetical protein